MFGWNWIKMTKKTITDNKKMPQLAAFFYPNTKTPFRKIGTLRSYFPVGAARRVPIPLYSVPIGHPSIALSYRSLLIVHILP